MLKHRSNNVHSAGTPFAKKQLQRKPLQDLNINSTTKNSHQVSSIHSKGKETPFVLKKVTIYEPNSKTSRVGATLSSKIRCNEFPTTKKVMSGKGSIAPATGAKSGQVKQVDLPRADFFQAQHVELAKQLAGMRLADGKDGRTTKANCGASQSQLPLKQPSKNAIAAIGNKNETLHPYLTKKKPSIDEPNTDKSTECKSVSIVTDGNNLNPGSGHVEHNVAHKISFASDNRLTVTPTKLSVTVSEMNGIKKEPIRVPSYENAQSSNDIPSASNDASSNQGRKILGRRMSPAPQTQSYATQRSQKHTYMMENAFLDDRSEEIARYERYQAYRLKKAIMATLIAQQRKTDLPQAGQNATSKQKTEFPSTAQAFGPQYPPSGSTNRMPDYGCPGCRQQYLNIPPARIRYEPEELLALNYLNRSNGKNMKSQERVKK